jgi:hypothetical protein
VLDETYGSDVATAEGITTRGTAYLSLSLAAEGAIEVGVARTVMDDMIDADWYCAPPVYRRIVQTVEGLDD